MTATIETFAFQTEARQLLDLMIHSIYSNKDIFLRELISNASDAIDKRRFESLQDPALMPSGTRAHILLTADKAARTITIEDNGIGMSREEVIDLIGTIAKSGTREFAKRLKENKDKAVDASLIGQFGVGFYSSFMVADRVTLLTRRAGSDTAVRWESTGDGTYTLEETTRDEAGTTITLHLKSDDEEGISEYLDPWKIRSIVKQYSDFVAYPIETDVEREVPERDAEGNVVEDKYVKSIERETLNSMKAIWLRDKASVTEEEYNEFYKHIGHDWRDPLLRIQAKIEGTLEYSMLLYIPGQPPMDLFMRPDQRSHGVQLYVQRVFIMEDCKELLPEYLRFVRGVVDSEDLSLNISREILQKDRQVQRMGKGIVGKILGALRDLQEKDAEKYLTFWKHFGRVLKEGLFQDHDNQEALLGLSRFNSTHHATEQTSLAEYIARMPEGQEAIYYMTGESRAKIESSPHLEAFLEKGYEVLLLDEPVDEVWVQTVTEFQDKKLQSIGKGAVELGTEEEKKQAEEARKEKEKEYATLLECLKAKLDAHVKEVRLSNRLTSSAACLVSGEPQLEQMMRSMGQEMPASKRILELNPNHPILEKLHHLFDANQEDPSLQDYADLLHGQAVLAEGGDLPNPGRFSKLVSELMLKTL
jgi:molecular chaperone HtpG